MLRIIVHSVIFLVVAGVVASVFVFKGEDENANAVAMLPALMLAGVYLGVLFVIYILPAITHKATSAVLDTNEIAETDPLHDARAAYARGDYAEAMSIYRDFAKTDPYNRLPWVEIAKIQHDNLENPAAALETLRAALESHEWPVNDAAYFMGRIAEIYLEGMEDTESCVTILNQMVELFPETRHSANATHKLRELGALPETGTTPTPPV